MKYYLDLFTGETWDEFLAHGGHITGFRETRYGVATRVTVGDRFVCYVTGISRFVGILEVKSKVYKDETPIWSNETFPVRFDVEPLITVSYHEEVPVLELRDRLKVFENLRNPNLWSGAFRGSPREFPFSDGEVILSELQHQQADPTLRPVNKRKLYGRSVYVSKSTTPKKEVTVPDELVTDSDSEPLSHVVNDVTSHTEIQWLLLKLGSDMGLDVWVARNDRGKEYKGKQFVDIQRLRNQLPLQFDDATNKTIELIDVLWLKGNTFVAAFEIESTTSVHSGLLRMSDLISMQPNISIPLFIVAPEERRHKVYVEVNRPTFANLPTALSDLCRYISFNDLLDSIRKHENVIRYLKPEFIFDDLSESCDLDDL